MEAEELKCGMIQRNESDIKTPETEFRDEDKLGREWAKGRGTHDQELQRKSRLNVHMWI